MVEQPGRPPSNRRSEAEPVDPGYPGPGEPAAGSSVDQLDLLDQLGRSLGVVGELIGQVGADQWAAATPCSDWTVQRLVGHLVGMNRVFAALLSNEPPPRFSPDHVEDDLVAAYGRSAADLAAVFNRPGILDQEFRSPLGVATGAERLQIRLYDLLAHGWDLAQATGQPVGLLPDDVAEHSLAFVRGQLRDADRPGRFGPPQPIAEGAPAIERLAAFLGRSVPAARGADKPA